MLTELDEAFSCWELWVPLGFLALLLPVVGVALCNHPDRQEAEV